MYLLIKNPYLNPLCKLTDTYKQVRFIDILQCCNLFIRIDPDKKGKINCDLVTIAEIFRNKSINYISISHLFQRNI